MLVSDIVNPVNTKIDNRVSPRFDNETIIETINECLREIAIHTNTYNKSATANLTAGTSTYDVPAPLIDLRYAYFSGSPISIFTTTEMDIKQPRWQTALGANTVEAVIYDEGTDFTIYPSISEAGLTVDLKGSTNPTIVSTLADTIDIKSLYLNILIYYVSGTLLTNSGRTEDINRGSAYLNEYTRRLKLASSNTTVNPSKDVLNFNTPFS